LSAVFVQQLTSNGNHRSVLSPQHSVLINKAMSKELKVLIIEDSEDDCLLLLRELRRGGYGPVHERVDTPGSMKAALEKPRWDVVISDYVMPKFSGLDALAILKESGLDLPFIIVSGNIGEDVAVEAMKAGAHDYILKGNLTRLVPAVEREFREAEVRRKRKEAEKRAISANALLEQIFSNIHVMIAYMDKDFNFIRVNPAYAEADEKAPEFFIGRNYFDIYPNEENEAIFRKVVETKEPYFVYEKPFEYAEHPSRGVTYGDWSLQPVQEADGKVSGVVLSLVNVTERKLAHDELDHSREQLRDLSTHLQTVREEERTRIAREIHDELGQALTGMKMDLSWMAGKYKDHGALFEKIASTLQLVDATIQTVKKISSELRPGILDHLGLSAAIEWQAGEFQKRTGISCDVTCEPADIVLDKDRSTALFRIFQETLTNVIRHAKATRVKARLEEDDGVIRLSVQDNGKGITEQNISRPRSFGLIGIRERVRIFDGTVEIKGALNKGTILTINIPLEKSRE
jgi:two-component system sensor histidine kinase UhpB